VSRVPEYGNLALARVLCWLALVDFAIPLRP
jgi:hypothetical protein